MKDWVKRGFTYSDGWVMDSRLVVLNAMAASELGADIRTRTRVVHGDRSSSHWNIVLLDELTGKNETVQARAVVNAAGPWVVDVITESLVTKTTKRIRLVKGSHIVCSKVARWRTCLISCKILMDASFL